MHITSTENIHIVKNKIENTHDQLSKMWIKMKEGSLIADDKWRVTVDGDMHSPCIASYFIRVAVTWSVYVALIQHSPKIDDIQATSSDTNTTGSVVVVSFY